MSFYYQSVENTCAALHTNLKNGLNEVNYQKNLNKYGKNCLTKNNKTSFIKKILNAIKEPMLIILLISFLITLSINIFRYFSFGVSDFGECFGILGAIILSVVITLIMEGSSEKAFNTLNKIYDNVVIKVIRQGKVVMVSQANVVVGDILILEPGDKIVADGRLFESNFLKIDESALTGESKPSNKNYNLIFDKNTPLAERKNMVYSGTFVVEGEGKMIVTAVGDETEIGGIADQLKDKKQENSPLQQKLGALSKKITIIGATCAIIVFFISLIRLIATGSVTFVAVQDLFISCIVLIVAAVPEGLPTIVAVSLALNMIKLAKSNALIKKMVATETAGAVSVICSDKTGTLTKNKMTVLSVCENNFCKKVGSKISNFLFENFILNSTAEVIKSGEEFTYKGNGTEGALISFLLKNSNNLDYKKYRKSHTILDRTPFCSKIKYMSTKVNTHNGVIEYIKGAPEIVLELCSLTKEQKEKVQSDIKTHQQKARRILTFAHKNLGEEPFVYDGYVVLVDEIRDDVVDAIKTCKKAGIKVKILTGDNYLTAFSVGEELGIVNNLYQVINGSEIESMSDETLKKVLPKISIVARSTPLVKLRVVKALKSLGEVVAVTGDGINDAPAIKHADVGISMGKSGSEISKEASDIILLDDSFSTIVSAICFGRNVYKNLQRFIVFQLSINIAALLIIMLSAIFGLNSPFNTFQLLWINVIMDGPPALTLGMESMSNNLMENPPVRREDGIISKNMMLKIAFSSIFVGVICFLQYFLNFLKVSHLEKSGTVFTLFIVFQLFNAFNSRELGLNSIFKSIGKNKIMLFTFLLTFLMQILIVSFGYKLFNIMPLSFISWAKIVLVAASVVVVSELFKMVLRSVKKKTKFNNFFQKNSAKNISKV